MRISLFIALAFTLAACNKKLLSQPPADDATPAERQRIDSAVDQITAMMKANGHSDNFRRLPIVVSGKDSEVANRVAYCQLNGDEGQYIVLYRKLFAQNEHDPELVDPVFATMLHEFGHCYFHREHESRAFGVPGQHIEVSAWGSSTGISLYVDQFPVSVMFVGADGLSSQIPTLKEFQGYYVREMLGLQVLRSLDEVLQFPGVRLRPGAPFVFSVQYRGER